jgi:PilZ domain
VGLFERRIATRHVQRGHALFIGLTGGAFLVDIKDISKGGCQISRPRGWPFNREDAGKIYIFAETGPVIHYDCRIAWFQDDSVGMEFM